jgi:protein-S-isoprenylcysteine O-methyltransferase Ste14
VAASDPSDNAGVRIPPPVFYAAAVVVGLLFDGVHSLPIAPAGIRITVAGVLIAAWLYLMIGSIQLFWRQRTSIVPIRPSTALVVSGPYRVTRNPMYVGLGLLTAALGFILNTWWPIVVLLPTLVAVDHFVIQREEAYLRRRFGGEYDTYTRQVRRWL